MADVLKTLAVLGARGDMTGRLLLPALVRLAGAGGLPADTALLAVDRDEGDDDAYRAHARAKLDAHLPDRDQKAAETLLEHLSYRQADVTSADDLRAAFEDAGTPMAVYLALPNVLFRPTLEALAGAGLPPHTTLVIEKPFGADLADARELNALIARSFDERDVFRIDHFLAKQTVLDVLGLRFANRIFEPVWNSDHISRVDITWYESLGLEGRANYYDRAGALRDMIQNHLLQMLALVAMEPPRSITERDLRDRKVEVLRAVAPPAADEMAQGDAAGSVHRGHLSAARSCRPTPTPRASTPPAAPRPSPRSPSASRTGAGPARRSGCAPARPSGPSGVRSRCTSSPSRTSPSTTSDNPDVLRFTLSPDTIALELNLNGEGDPFDLERVALDAAFPTQELPPYSLLLQEIMEGDSTLSIRGDEAEELWRVVEPVLQAWERDEVPLKEYPAGSAGPSGAKKPPKRIEDARDPRQGTAEGDDAQAG